MATVKKVIEGDKRSIVAELETSAPLDSVWQALTDPEILANWFPLRARVEGKVGGDIQFDWKPLFEFNWIDEITVWEPNKRLTFAPKAEEKNDNPYVVDFTLESSKGKTIVRMVHGGMENKQKWDEEFNSFYGGWTYELMSLQFYLDHHRGKQRRMAWARADLNEASIKDAVARVAEKQGMFMGRAVKDLSKGESYRFLLAPDEIIEGEVIQVNPEVMDVFAGTAKNLNNGLLRIGTGKKFAFMWLALYDVPEKRVEELQTKMRARFAELFSEHAVN